MSILTPIPGISMDCTSEVAEMLLPSQIYHQVTQKAQANPESINGLLTCCRSYQLFLCSNSVKYAL